MERGGSLELAARQLSAWPGSRREWQGGSLARNHPTHIPDHIVSPASMGLRRLRRVWTCGFRLVWATGGSGLLNCCRFYNG